MKKFEIHITGDNKGILLEFETLRIKTLKICLLDPKFNEVGDEFMCCIQKSFETYEKCLEYTLTLVSKLKSEIARIKIESCFYEEYLDKAIYSEVHISPRIMGLPTVYNINSNKYVSTERTYNRNEFLDLKKKYEDILGSEFELCLFDSNKDFDNYWLSFYK